MTLGPRKIPPSPHAIGVTLRFAALPVAVLPRPQSGPSGPKKRFQFGTGSPSNLSSIMPLVVGRAV